MSVATGGLALVSVVSLWETRSEPALLRWRGTGLALVALVFWSGLSGLSADLAGTVQDVRIKRDWWWVAWPVGGRVTLPRVRPWPPFCAQ